MSLIPDRIDAVTLAVADLGRSTEFYREVMGFQQVSESEMVSGFRLGPIGLDLIDRQALLDETNLDGFPTGPSPVTLVLRVTRDEVDEYMTRLKDAGVHIVAPAEDKPLGPRIGYAADPDGHLWEIGAFE